MSTKFLRGTQNINNEYNDNKIRNLQETIEDIEINFDKLDRNLEQSSKKLNTSLLKLENLGKSIGYMMMSNNHNNSSNLLKDLGYIFAKQLVQSNKDEILSGVKNIIGGMFGGMRAHGGYVSQTQAYVVGEKGPEIFSPHSNGKIIPNNKMNININLQDLNMLNNFKLSNAQQITKISSLIAKSSRNI